MFEFNANKPHSFVLFCITPAITESGRSLGSGGGVGRGGKKHPHIPGSAPVNSYFIPGNWSCLSFSYSISAADSELSSISEVGRYTPHIS